MSHARWHRYSNRDQDKPWYWRPIRKEIEENLEVDRVRAEEAARQNRENTCRAPPRERAEKNAQHAAPLT
jgi:hypothetical protein